MTTLESHLPPHLTWDKGGHASIVSVNDDAVVLRSSIPSPPGSRLEGTLTSDPPARVRVKMHSSKREERGEEASFVLTGRLIDATRELRARLSGLAV